MRILFAHGAGLGSNSPWMRAWAERLAAFSTVRCFDYPYMQAGARRPDPQPRLVASHRRALEAVRKTGSGPIVLAGKSMGSRIGCHLSLTEPDVAGLVCFGYPLVGAGKKRPLRDQVLRELHTPILFVQGTRDKLCPLDTLQEVRAAMQTSNELLIVDDGDHSLQVAKRTLKANAQTQDDVDNQIADGVARFCQQLASGTAVG